MYYLPVPSTLLRQTETPLCMLFYPDFYTLFRERGTVPPNLQLNFQSETGRDGEDGPHSTRFVYSYITTIMASFHSLRTVLP